MDLNVLLGIDPSNPLDQQAASLVEADDTFLDALKARRIAANLTRQECARIMGVRTEDVVHIESGQRDPRLSTLRRYAMAVGATYSHEVS